MKRLILTLLALTLLTSPSWATTVQFSGSMYSSGGGYAMLPQAYTGELDYTGTAGELTIIAPLYPYHGAVTITSQNPLTASSPNGLPTDNIVAFLSSYLPDDYVVIQVLGWPCKGSVTHLEVVPNAVPLPGSVWLLMAGLGAMGIKRKGAIK